MQEGQLTIEDSVQGLGKRGEGGKEGTFVLDKIYLSPCKNGWDRSTQTYPDVILEEIPLGGICRFIAS